jgi:type IV pilus assembly protein PilC
MPTFMFTARDRAGTLFNGSMVADSTAAAVESLRAEGKYPTSLTSAEESAPRRLLSWAPAARLTRKDLLQFATQLAVMVETGVTLSDALDSIASQSHKPPAKKVIEDLCRRVQDGDTFSSALIRHPRSFPRLMVALVAASEKSGLMAKLLNRTVSYLRDEHEIRRKVRGALTYPAIMFVFAISTTCFLLTFVMPKFTAIYAAKKAALPALTQMLLIFSHVLIADWYWILIAAGALAGAAWRYGRTPAGRRLFNYIQLKVPLFGPLLQKMHLSRGLRLIGTMAASGISLPDCVHTAYDLCPNVYFRDLWEEVGAQIQAGKQFSQPLFENPLVPKSIAQMLHSAEKGGKLAAVMEQVAAFAEAELKEQVTDLTRYVEPVMIMVMGAIIGTVALALMLPIFTISKVIVK